MVTRVAKKAVKKGPVRKNASNQSAGVGKNIVVCSDGTGNSALKGRGTNVFKLFESVDVHRPGKIRQVVIYDDGVGTQSNKFIRLLSAATGLGLGRNVRQLYTELAHVYNPGDRIYLFGFSRGAFTVRTLAGLIYQCGVLDHALSDKGGEAELRARSYDAYRAYRGTHPAFVSWLVSGVFHIVRPLVRPFIGWIPVFNYMCRRKLTVKQVRDEYALGSKNPSHRFSKFVAHGAQQPHENERPVVPPIECIGVWDTVAALGVPFKWLAFLVNNVVYRFQLPGNDLCRNVNHGFHALSIDDERQTFHPALWREDERVEQVWFSGVHTDVGGGYERHGVSLTTLGWMIDKLALLGPDSVSFVPGDLAYIKSHRNVTDKVHDSRAGKYTFYRYAPRRIGRLCEAAGIQPQVHVSAFYRIAQAVDGYAPGNLPGNLEVVDSHGPSRHHQHISALLNAGLAGQECLLDRVGFYVLMRQIGYYLLALSVAAMAIMWLIDLVYGISNGVSGDVSAATALLAPTESLENAKTAFHYLVNRFSVLSTMAFLGWVLGLWAKGVMENRFTMFWFRHLVHLRKPFRLSSETRK